MTFAFYALLTFFFVLCLLFAGLILVQKGRGGGISSAFGGAGGNTAFGSKTGDVLTWATSIVFGIFLVCCVSLSLLATEIDQRMTGKTPVAPASATGSVPLATPTTAPAGGTSATASEASAIAPTEGPALPAANQPTTAPPTSRPAAAEGLPPLGEKGP